LSFARLFGPRIREDDEPGEVKRWMTS